MARRPADQSAIDEFTGLGGIVTGAAGGIGSAVARLLCSRGARVLAVDVDQEGLQRLAADHPTSPGELITHQADVTDARQVEGYVARALDEFGAIRLFHNNAGVGGDARPISETAAADWDRVMNINVRSVFLGFKYALPPMVQSGAGAVVTTGSLLSFRGAAGRADYCTSKHAVIGLTRAAAAECARAGVKVNAVCPGPTETPLMSRLEEASSSNPSAHHQRIADRIPVGRYATPGEVAEIVAFLLRPDMTYFTGSAVTVDGGLLNVHQL